MSPNCAERSTPTWTPTDICFLDGWSVIDSIASHSNHIALPLTSLDNQQLLVRNCTSEDDVLVVQDHIIQLHERHVCQVGTVHDDS